MFFVVVVVVVVLFFFVFVFLFCFCLFFSSKSTTEIPLQAVNIISITISLNEIFHIFVRRIYSDLYEKALICELTEATWETKALECKIGTYITEGLLTKHCWEQTEP